MPPSSEKAGTGSRAKKKPRIEESLEDKAKRLLGWSAEKVGSMSEEALKELVKMKEMLEKKDEQLEEAKLYSLRRLIEKPPTMSLEAVGSKDSHTGRSKHDAAEAKEHEEVEVEEIPEKYWDKPSQLLLKLGAHKKGGDSDELKNTYDTESDVSGYISAALEDAVFLVDSSIDRKLYVHHEFSLFSDRPDHLVVFDKETNDPILAVEDKKPWDAKEEITKPVLGQVFDYILELRGLGHSAPFVVLSTFIDSWLFWEKNEHSNELVGKKGRLEKVLPLSSSDPTSPAQRAATTKKTPSPPELTNEKVSGVTSSLFDSLPRDNLLMSKKYPSTEFVQLLYTAILCGLAGNSTSPCKSVTKRTGGCNGIALRLYKNGYAWGNLKLKDGDPVKFMGGTDRRPIENHFPESNYFAVKKIGRVATSKVFDAYNWSGQRCVIKMYVKRAEKNGELLSFKESKKVGEKACKQEVARLKAFYPFLEKQVRYEELHKFPCVIMPFFEPLTTEERNKSNGKIQQCLSSFRDAHGCWRYGERDLRWRHVGYFVEGSKKRMVMFDLADLEKVMEGKLEDAVDKQVADLFKRLPKS